MYQQSSLANGIRVVSHTMKERNSVALGFWVGAGGRFETDAIKGAAHFLEHIVFKGSQKYSCGQIKEMIEGVGGSLNAFTSEEETCYYAKIPSCHLNQTFDVLSDMVFFPQINQRDVLKEKTVIVEEIKMYHDLPQYYVLELLDALLWPGHPLGKSLAGSEETVTHMRSSDLKKFHRAYYSPSNVVVSAAGNIDHKEVVRLVEKKLGGVQNFNREDSLKVERTQTGAKIRFSRKNIEQMHLALGMPGYNEFHPDRYGLTLLNIILGGNMSSRLFNEVREKRGLAYSISSCSKPFSDTGLFLIRAGVDSRKIIQAVELILKELKKIKRYGITDDEFKRAKEYIMGQLGLALEDTMDHMLWMGESMLAKNKIKTFKCVIEEFKKVQKGDIKRIANDVLQESQFNLALVGPITDEQEEQLTALLGVMN